MIFNSIFVTFILAKVNGAVLPDSVRHGAGSWHPADWFNRCKWSGPMVGSIASRNIDCFSGETIETCKAKCDDETNCKSIDFRGSDGECCLGDCRIGEECANDHDKKWVYYACLNIGIENDMRNLPFLTETDPESPNHSKEAVEYALLADYDDFSSRAVMEANGWEFTHDGDYMFIEPGHPHRDLFCKWVAAYCGFYWPGDAGLSVRMRSSGTVKITYGGSFGNHQTTYVKLEVNGVEKSRVIAPAKGYSIIRVMKDDIVSFTEVGESVINIHEFKFEPAPHKGVEKNCDWNIKRPGRVEGKNLRCWDNDNGITPGDCMRNCEVDDKDCEEECEQQRKLQREDCMEKCEQHEDCKTVNYDKNTGSCCIGYSRSGDGTYGTTRVFLDNTNTGSYDYDYEIEHGEYWSCKDPYERCDWSMAVMGAIAGRTIGGCYEGKTPAQCKQLCEFTENCKSIDHTFDGRCCLHDCDIESQDCNLTPSDDHMYYTCDSRTWLNTAEDQFWNVWSYHIENGICNEWANGGDLAGICCLPLALTGTSGIGWPGKKYTYADCATKSELVANGAEDLAKPDQDDRSKYIRSVCPNSCQFTLDNIPGIFGR